MSGAVTPVGAARRLLVLAAAYPLGLATVSGVFAALYQVDLPSWWAALVYFLPYPAFAQGLLVGSARIVAEDASACGPSSEREKAPRWITAALGLGAACILSAWVAMIAEYGSIEFILAHAFDIRGELIGGEGIAPLWTGYAFSFVYFAFLSEAMRLAAGDRRISWQLAACFGEICLYDLTTFGRVGMLLAVAIALAAAIYHGVTYRLGAWRVALVGATVAFVVSIPRLIRGGFDNFAGSLEDLPQRFPGLVPESLNALAAYAKYAVGSLFALGEKLPHHAEDWLYGRRTFLPVWNLASRFTGGHYMNRIDDPVSVPFELNIYSVAWDFYLDFSVAGVVVGALAWGYLVGRTGSSRSPATRRLAVLLVAGFLFWPIYNVFTFGGPFIVLVLASVAASRPSGVAAQRAESVA